MVIYPDCQAAMKKVISASRRADLVSSYPDWLAESVLSGQAVVQGPRSRRTVVDLRPDSVHTMVLWSKNFLPLIENRFRLREALSRYDQLYLHFTITGMGGSFIEPGILPPAQASVQLAPLVEVVGSPERISVRFDPIVFWRAGKRVRTNLGYFERLAPVLESHGVRDVRISFAQWYAKARRRASKGGLDFIDPAPEEKRAYASELVETAKSSRLRIHACSQDFLLGIGDIRPSSCIDGVLLRRLHPHGEAVSEARDRSQREECRCTRSVEIGSYTQICPHPCIYCYACP